MTLLTLAHAESIAKAAAAKAREKGFNPMSISVIDGSGNLKFALREDGAGLAGVDIALGKARAALNFGCTSRQISEGLSHNPLAGPSVLAVFQGKIVLLPGAVLIKDIASGQVIGAVGAAGDAPDNDEAIVLAATGA